jgi:hypothetical protein
MAPNITPWPKANKRTKLNEATHIINVVHGTDATNKTNRKMNALSRVNKMHTKNKNCDNLQIFKIIQEILPTRKPKPLATEI